MPIKELLFEDLDLQKMSSSQMNDSADVIDIRTANRSKMMPNKQTQASANSQKTSAASNYAQ